MQSYHRSSILSVLLPLLLGVLLFVPVYAANGPSVFGEKLSSVLPAATGNEMLHVILFVSPEPNPQELAQYISGVSSMQERRFLILAELRARAEESQDGLLDLLYAEEQTGGAAKIRSIALTNTVDADLTPAVIRRVAVRPEVVSIEYSPDEYAIEPVENPGGGGGDELDETGWHVIRVNADDVWNLGYTGEGILVAVLDTGVNYNHVDLADHLWDGGVEYPNHGYDLYNNDDNPMDGDGHGTHCAGIVAGDGAAGTHTGVAPDATIMCVKILSDDGNGELSDVWAGLEFAMEHGADHTTLSAGWYSVPADLRRTNRNVYETTMLAGMTATKSVGNSGNSPFYQPPNQVSSPGKVPPPWHNPDQTEAGGPGGLVAVGATDNNDNIANFSSHGPVTWENISPWNDYDYNNGLNQGLLKPEVSAPGVNITSLNLNNGYYIMSGTSMASPCGAGVIALIRCVNPNLTPEQVDEILETTALDRGTAGKDNTYGAGRVDALAAVLMAEETLFELAVEITPLHDPYVIPHQGGTLTFDAVISNGYGVATPGNVWTEANLPNGNTHLINVFNVTFHPGMDIVVTQVQQWVPGGAPDGDYQYVVKAGQYPGPAAGQDSFDFTKSNQRRAVIAEK